MDDKNEKFEAVPSAETSDAPLENSAHLINSSGHVQEMDRSFGIFALCSIGILSDNAWGSAGGSLVVSLYNGGGPGVVYGFLASVVFYAFIGAGLAELSSAIPSSANVYSWASVTAGRRSGRILSFFAGWWNCLAWTFGASATSLFCAQTVLAMYTLYHPQFTPERWQFFIVYVVVAWTDLSLVLFGQRILALAAGAMGTLLILIWFVTTMVCAIMPSQTGYGYASNAFVWSDFQNLTGWSSDGLVFIMGILNGAYAIGTPDGVCHLCEEIPRPKKNVPWAIFCQLLSGSVTTFAFLIAILYAVTDLNAVFNGSITALPLASVFQQATRSRSGTLGLLVLFLINNMINQTAGFVNCGRMLWTLARDDAVPFSHVFRRIDSKWRNPFYAQVACGCFVTILGAIYVGNATAFTAFVSCFTILTTWSYCAALLPHLLTRRRYVKPGPFWMPAWVAYPVLSIACAYILIFNVIYMFPYTYPVTVQTMNYACVMSGGLTILLALWYLWKRNHGYTGPSVAVDGHDNIVKGVVGLTWEQEKAMRHSVQQPEKKSEQAI